MELIKVENLVKVYHRKKASENLRAALLNMIHPKYDEIVAVNNISFSVDEGEAIGYIGANGSGKSTTIKMLTGILTPTQGKIYVDGREPSKERIENSKNIGVVMGNRSVLYWDVSIVESFKVFQKIYEIPENIFQKNLHEFSKIMEIEDLLGVPERQLSLGQRMRCNIVAAFLHNPKIIYLDEPTIGLDTNSKNKIREFIRKMNIQNKTTFIVTSHDFQDIETLCKRIILINHGEKILDCDIEKVRKKFDQMKKITFEVESNKLLMDKIVNDNSLIIKLKGEYIIEIEYDERKHEIMDIIKNVSKKCKIKDIAITGRDIETIVYDIINNA